MRTLLTGANGFVGSNIRTFFESKNSEIIPVGRQEVINWQNIDSKPIGADVYIHTAGKAHDLKGKAEEREYFEVNVGLTQKLFHCFIRDKAARDFIFFSSVKAAASRVEGILLETDRFDLEDAYGMSKRAAEDWLLEQKLPEGRRLIILRPCMIYGQGHKGNLNLLKKLISWNIPYPMATFENERSFVSIDFVLQILDRFIANKKIPGGIYNVAEEGYMSTNDWIIKLSLEMGKKPKLWRISPKIIRGLAYLGDYLRLPLNSHRLKKLTENYRVSCEKLERLGFI